MWRVFCSSIVRWVVGTFLAMQVPSFLPRERLILSYAKCQNIDEYVRFLNTSGSLSSTSIIEQSCAGDPSCRFRQLLFSEVFDLKPTSWDVDRCACALSLSRNGCF